MATYDPMLGDYRSGDISDPYAAINDDIQKVANGICKLREIPYTNDHVQVIAVLAPFSGESYYEVFTDPSVVLGTYNYRVDYDRQLVYFNTSANGRYCKFQYTGRGQKKLSANQVYDAGNLDQNGNIVQTLQDIIDLGGSQITALSQLTQDTTHRIVTDAEKATWSGKVDQSQLGTLSSLSTSNKTSTVSAINEINAQVATATTFTVSGLYDRVYSLPPTALYGKLGMNIYSSTITNLLGTDGDCEDASKWSNYQVTSELDSTKKMFGNNSIKITVSSGSSGSIYKTKPEISIQDGQYYFMSAYAQPNSGSIYIGINGIGNSDSVTSTFGFTRIGIKFYANNMQTPFALGIYMNGSVGVYGNVDSIMINEISLTEYTNDSVQTLLAKYSYVNNTVGTGAMKVTSCGVNKFNTKGYFLYGNSDPTKRTFEESGKITVPSGLPISWFAANENLPIRVKPNTNYTISVSNDGYGRFSVTKLNYNYDDTIHLVPAIPTFDTGLLYATFNSGNTDKVWILYCSDVGNTGSNPAFSCYITLTEGTSVLPYEPYKEAVVYIPSIGDSTPNGSYNQIDISLSKKTQNVSDRVNITGNEAFSSFETASTNTCSAKVLNWTIDKNIKQDGGSNMPNDAGFAYSNDGNYSIGYVSQDIRRINASTAPSSLTVRIEKSKISTMPSGLTLAGFKEYLNLYPVTMVYLLAVPVTTPIEGMGQLVAYPSGSLIIENKIQEVQKPTSGVITIKNTAFPIKTVISCKRLDLLPDGSVQFVDNAFTNNSTTVTITAPDNTKDYQIEYEYSSDLSSNPLWSANYCTNLGAVISGNTDQIVQLNKIVRDLILASI